MGRLTSPDPQALQFFKADSLGARQVCAAFITHQRQPWERSVGGRHTAGPEGDAIGSRCKQIGQADHGIGAIGDGARNHLAPLVGGDEGNIGIGQQCWQKEPRLWGG